MAYLMHSNLCLLNPSRKSITSTFDFLIKKKKTDDVHCSHRLVFSIDLSDSRIGITITSLAHAPLAINYTSFIFSSNNDGVTQISEILNEYTEFFPLGTSTPFLQRFSTSIIAT